MKFCSECGTKLNGEKFCPNCGHSTEKVNTKKEENNDNNTIKAKKSNKGYIIAIIILAILGLCIYSIGISSYYKNKEEYEKLDVQQLNKDYVDNELSAVRKHSEKYYYLTDKIYKIESFLTDNYIVFMYEDKTNKGRAIEIDAYFSDVEKLQNIKKGDKVTVYCKFDKRAVENWAGTTSYSLHYCQFFD